MKDWKLRLIMLLIPALLLGWGGVMPVFAEENPYQTGLILWQSQANDFLNWQQQGVTVGESGVLQLQASSAQPQQDPYPAGGYKERNYYNGGQFWVGEATSPVTASDFGYQGALVSWNAQTPSGTWIEMQIRAQVQDRWTKWYSYGVWAADRSTVDSHSIDEQGDDDADLYTDTLVLKDQPAGSTAYQVKARLFSVDPQVSPTLRNVAVAVSTVPAKPETLQVGNPQLWNRALSLPQCSQMVYPDGGEVWCSPTSVSMVLGYWQKSQDPCEPRVRSAVEGVFDWLYDGHGNWVFNTAYASSQNLQGFVTRFTSLSQLEPWIAAGVPVVFSFAWKAGELTGAPLPKSDGHLAVLVGFDAAGNPIVNDPAADQNEEVRRIYRRQELETLWLHYSGGTVYLIYPANWSIPPLE